MANISPAQAAGNDRAPIRPRPDHRFVAGRMELGRIVNSHGWRTLAPFSWDPDGQRLATAAVVGSRAVAIDLSQSGARVLVEAWGEAGREELRAVAERMLWTDLDLAEFHARCRRQKRYREVAAAGDGRLLRSPSPWEDLVKVLASRPGRTSSRCWPRPTSPGAEPGR